MAVQRFTRGPKILVEMANRILDEVESGTIKPGSNVRTKRSRAGTLVEFNASASSSAAPTPFQIYCNKHFTGSPPTWDGTHDVTFYPGNINQVIPSNMFSTINQAISSTYYVVLTCTSDGYNVSGCSLSLESSAPTPMSATGDLPPGTFYVIIGILFYVSGNVIVYQMVDTDLLASPAVWTTTTRPAAGPFDLNYINYYFWNIQGAAS
jgi:hypothetical protein